MDEEKSEIEESSIITVTNLWAHVEDIQHKSPNGLTCLIFASRNPVNLDREFIKYPYSLVA